MRLTTTQQRRKTTVLVSSPSLVAQSLMRLTTTQQRRKTTVLVSSPSLVAQSLMRLTTTQQRRKTTVLVSSHPWYAVPDASNYDPAATEDDGSCEFPILVAQSLMRLTTTQQRPLTTVLVSSPSLVARKKQPATMTRRPRKTTVHANMLTSAAYVEVMAFLKALATATAIFSIARVYAVVTTLVLFVQKAMF